MNETIQGMAIGIIVLIIGFWSGLFAGTQINAYFTQSIVPEYTTKTQATMTTPYLVNPINLEEPTELKIIKVTESNSS